MADDARIELQGADQLIKMIDEIVAEEGAKSINAVMRKATRKACKEIILPAVKDLIAVETGFLEDQLVVRAVKRSRGHVGHFVGFKDPLFEGDTYYGGYLEFGYTDRAGGHVPADSFLRRPLYENEDKVRQLVRDELAAYVREKNRKVRDRL